MVSSKIWTVVLSSWVFLLASNGIQADPELKDLHVLKEFISIGLKIKSCNGEKFNGKILVKAMNKCKVPKIVDNPRELSCQLRCLMSEFGLLSLDLRTVPAIEQLVKNLRESKLVGRRTSKVLAEIITRKKCGENIPQEETAIHPDCKKYLPVITCLASAFLDTILDCNLINIIF